MFWCPAQRNKEQPPPLRLRENIAYQPLKQLPLGTIFRPECPLSHGIRRTRVWEHSDSHQPPCQALRETPAPLLHPQTIGMLWNYHHLPTIVCLFLKEIKHVQSPKCSLHHIHTTRSTKGHTYRWTGNMWEGILDMLRKSSPVISEQVSRWDDAVQPQWRVSLLLSAWNTTSVLSTKTKTSPRLSRLFPPVHRPLNRVFLRLFLTQTRFSWF